jgi:hypothetical protein
LGMLLEPLDTEQLGPDDPVLFRDIVLQ